MPIKTRRWTETPLVGAQLSSPSDYHALLARLGPVDLVVVLDMALGSVQAHSALKSCCRQLQIATPNLFVYSPEYGLDGGEPVLADYIGLNIDREGQGDHAVSQAFAYAEHVLAAVAHLGRIALLIVPPSAGAAWGREDRLFLRFLTKLAPTERWSFRLICSTETAEETGGFVVERLESSVAEATTPDHRFTWGLLPGLLPPEFVATYPPEIYSEHAVSLPDGSVFCLPHTRIRPRPARPQDYARFVAKAGALTPSQRLYINLRGYPMHRDSKVIIESAIRSYIEGGLDYAIELIDLLVPTIGDEKTRALMELERARMLVARGRFERLSNTPVPPSWIDAETRSRTLALKAWGLVMIGAAEQAHGYFTEALEESKYTFDVREQFIYRNIWALAYFRRGQAETAVALEKHIEQALTERRDRGLRQDWPMTYINGVNLARLHRALRQFEPSERQYRRAFATTTGVKSDTDVFHEAFVWARWSEAQERWDGALAHWISAGVAYVSMPLPEGLGARPLSSLFKRRLLLENNSDQSVAAALVEKIEQCWAKSSLDLDARWRDQTSWLPTLRQVQAVESKSLASALLVGRDGCFLYALDTPLAPVIDGEHDRALRRLLGVLLCAHVPGLSALRPATLLVDTQQGLGPAQTRAQAMARATYLGLNQSVCADGQVRSFEQPYALGRNPGIEMINAKEAGAEVVFCRYRAPVSVDTQTCALLVRLVEPVGLVELGQEFGISMARDGFIEGLVDAGLVCVVAVSDEHR